MYRDILESIAGVGIFPVLSLLIFVSVFTGVLVATRRLSAARLDQFARMPLDKGDNQ